MIERVTTLLPETPPAAPSRTEQAPLAEYFRALFQHLRVGLQPTPGLAPTIGVTSCLGGEGVSTVARNLAVAAAQNLRKPVLLMDAAFGTHIVPAGGEPSGGGLYDILLGNARAADCIQPAGSRDVFLLETGTSLARGSLPLPKEAFVDLLADLRPEFGFIVADLPVANELSHCFSIGSLLDGVLLVVEAERVRNQVVARARDQLQQCGARLLGVVFNKRRNHVPDWLYRRL